MTESKPVSSRRTWIRIATYNIHQCVGMDGRRDVDRIAAVIREMDADIVGLQEVDSDPAGFRDSKQMDYVASLTGYEAVPGFTIMNSDRHYGNVLLSRFPIVAARREDLSISGHEPRAAIDAEIRVLGNRVRVVVTHLGLKLRERRDQTACLLDAIEPGPMPTVLLGDLNEWIPLFGTGRRFRERFGHRHHPRSFPGCCPFIPLDRIHCEPDALLADTWAHRTALSRVASDHLPVVAAFYP